MKANREAPPGSVAVIGYQADRLHERLAHALPAAATLVPVTCLAALLPHTALVLLATPPDDADADALAAYAAQRAALQTFPAPWAVLHGPPDRQVAQALAAMKRLCHPPDPGAGPAWVCGGECSDPDCEHRLFRRLLPKT